MFPLDPSPEIKIGDIFTLVGLLFAGVSLLVTAYQLRINSRVQKAQFLLDITDRYFSDSEIRSLFYKLDHREFVFDENNVRGNNELRTLDKLLYILDVIGRMVRMKTITVEEVNILRFQILRVLDNHETNKYLNWLDRSYTSVETARPAISNDVPVSKKQKAHTDARFLRQRLIKSNQ
ncbi:MAG TPA: hypothetical protein VGD58_21945 [Herpetosiphonaceae bacterium]